MVSPISRRHLSVMLIVILLSAAVFAGIAAADTTDGDLAVNETQMDPPPDGAEGRGDGMTPPDNSTMPLDNGTMPLDNRTPDMGFDPANLTGEFNGFDSVPTETAESPVPALGIVAGLSAAVFFLTRKT